MNDVITNLLHTYSSAGREQYLSFIVIVALVVVAAINLE